MARFFNTNAASGEDCAAVPLIAITDDGLIELSFIRAQNQHETLSVIELTPREAHGLAGSLQTTIWQYIEELKA